MYNLFWQIFKNTGNIEAYLYINNHDTLLKKNEKKGEK